MFKDYKMSFDEIARSLYLFYARPENANVTMSDALVIMNYRAKGMSWETILHYTEDARRAAGSDAADDALDAKQLYQ